MKVGVQSTVEGRALDDSLVSALRLAAADTLGATLATEIGTFAAFNGVREGDVIKVVLHATAGCVTGAVGSGDCVASAIGAGLGELLGKPIAEAVSDQDQQTRLLAMIAGFSAVLATGDAGAVNAASGAATTTHRYNYLSHAEMLAQLNAERALAACADQSATCSPEERRGLQNEIDRLKTLDQLRDAELKLVCSSGNRWQCGQLLQQSYQAALSYQAAQGEANQRGMSLAEYVASVGGQSAADALLTEYKSIDRLRQEVSRTISGREAAELQAVLNGFGIGAAGGAVAAGGYIIATSAIPAAITCLQNPVCFNEMGIALAEASAGDALGGASLAPAISVASGMLVLRKGDEVVGVIEQATGKAVSLSDDVLANLGEPWRKGYK
ncbi:DUF637 domain-containing protein [Notoacmeibacter marinus]|uniref:DUF637 domain-containing protein n=1 Tax=Notoacmeibacter marinus TaxID=1876515 RepID=UPI000DF12D12|nr:DUF637 domain-containing protein [Notoacmeibacter marinus]